MDFENKIIEGIYATRFVASWMNEGGTFRGIRRGRTIVYPFKEWLATLTVNGRKLTEDEICHIFNLATNGKMELEHNAMEFIENMNKED